MGEVVEPQRSVNPAATIDLSKLNQRHPSNGFFARLQTAPQGTILYLISDGPEASGNYDLFAFPSQYRRGAIPTETVAQALGLEVRQGENPSLIAQSALEHWFQIYTMPKRGGWDRLPPYPDPETEVFRSQYARLRIQRENAFVLLMLDAFSLNGATVQRSERIYLSIPEAQNLIQAILNERPTRVQGREREVRLSLNENLNLTLRGNRVRIELFSPNIRLLVVNALLRAVEEVPA